MATAVRGVAWCGVAWRGVPRTLAVKLLAAPRTWWGGELQSLPSARFYPCLRAAVLGGAPRGSAVAVKAPRLHVGTRVVRARTRAS